jgi:hypothetical protein
MNAADNDNSCIDRPTSPAALRLEAVRARARAAEAHRPPNERIRDLTVSKAFDGLADNREYLNRQRTTFDANKKTT